MVRGAAAIWWVGGAYWVFLTRMEMLADIWKLLQIFLEEPLNISAAALKFHADS